MKLGINGASVVKTSTFINRIAEKIPVNVNVIKMVIDEYQQELSNTLFREKKDIYIDEIGTIRLHKHPQRGRHVAGGENVCTAELTARLHMMTKNKKLLS